MILSRSYFGSYGLNANVFERSGIGSLSSLSSQNNSLLNQLRAMHQGNQPYEPEPQYQGPQPQAQYEAPVNQAYSEVNGVPNMSFEEAGLASDADMLEIERVVDTKE
jgi:hypothetical protein